MAQKADQMNKIFDDLNLVLELEQHRMGAVSAATLRGVIRQIEEHLENAHKTTKTQEI